MELPGALPHAEVPQSSDTLPIGASRRSVRADDADSNGGDFNRVQVLYNGSHPPLMFGVINVVCGAVENQRNHGPFLVSKRLADGSKVVFGTVTGVIDKIAAQFDRFGPLNREFERALDAAGIAVDPAEPVLPPGTELDALMDKQDRLIEEVLLTTSIYFRTLVQQFNNRLAKFKVTVCDYESKPVGDLDLKSVGDLMAHNRFITVHN